MRHKKHFNMRVVAKRTECGTAMCIAGHALDLAGYKMRLRRDVVPKSFGDFGRLDFDYVSPNGYHVVERPLLVAARELGLTPDEAHPLFHDFTLKTPRQAAKRIEVLIEELSPA
jgi:hypothetical protein